MVTPVGTTLADRGLLAPSLKRLFANVDAHFMVTDLAPLRPLQSQSLTRWHWLSFVIGLLAGALVAIAGSALVPTEGQPGTWASASEMADAVGCAETFAAREVTDGTAGSCEVLGSTVMLRTFSDYAAQRAWVDGVASAKPGKTVSVQGEGYVALSTTYDRDIMAVIGPALSK
ncbi:MAG: hypothetical protein OEW53_03635 [Actinomycetota bacterium]|nr:hypothetical protein [Actinomycetota bacterium]